MLCPACQAENKEGAKFCNECGTALALRCPACGTGVRAGQKFCDECGTRLSEGAPGTTSPGAPPPSPPARPEGAPGVAELRLVSVLFVDLVGFTSLSESREAEDIRELLGRYFDSARTIVERYGGTIQKFIGDAVMAVWGAPIAREDDAERAVRAALEMVDAVAVFGEQVGAPDLRARAGVVTGQVAALENPGEGLVVGDRVNTASRVQSAAQPGSVLVDEITRQVTMAAVAYEDAGEHSVKGKAEPLRLWRAVRVVAGVGGSEREEGLDAPFVGREGDLRLLKELFHGALERRSARLVAVSAEAGLGKSRLRREFSNYVDGLAERVLWHSGRCVSYGEGVAYWALAEMVRQRFAITEDASAEVAGAKLAAGLERWVSDPGDREFLSPRLGALLGVAEPGLGREELFAGWRLFFERLAAHEPVTLVFEDMQWADDGLLEFVEQLLDWSASSPIFILVLTRPELPARHEGWPAGRRGATTLQLDPLGDEAMRSLLDGLVGGLPEEAKQLIVSQAQGVPLYAIETIRALADRGVLVERDGGLMLEGELGDLDVPASLSSLIAARLDSLEPEERGLVKAMSVFAGAFPRSAAAALAGVPDHRLDAVLASLVRRQVLVIRADPLSPDRGQYAFAQGLLRTVAYEMLSRQERKPRHRTAAEYLRRAFPNDGEDVAEAIASHYLDAYRAAADDADAGTLRAESLAALRRAAQRAATIGAPDAAERTYRTAIDLAVEERERTDLTQAAGEMALQSGRLEATLELFGAASAAHRAAGRELEAARINGRMGFAVSFLGNFGEAIEWMTVALNALGPDRVDAEVAALHHGIGRAQVFIGDYEHAAPSLEAALSIAEALRLEDVLATSLVSKGIMYLFTGRSQEARYLLRAAIEIAERHDLTEMLARAHLNAGVNAMQEDVAGAGEHFEASMAVSRRRGDRYLESVAAGNLMTVHLFSGRWEEIDRLAPTLLEEGLPGVEEACCRLAILHAKRGEPEAARAMLARASALARSYSQESRAAYAGAEVSVRLGEGDAEGALEGGAPMLKETIETLAPANEQVRFAWPDTLEAALSLARLDDAREVMALLEGRPPGHIPPYLQAQLARGRALIAAAEGRHKEVETDLAAAIERLRELGYPYWLAVAQTDLAEWLGGQDRMAEAHALLEEAIGTFESLGAGPALTRARRLTESPGAAPVAG